MLLVARRKLTLWEPFNKRLLFFDDIYLLPVCPPSFALKALSLSAPGFPFAARRPMEHWRNQGDWARFGTGELGRAKKTTAKTVNEDNPAENKPRRRTQSNTEKQQHCSHRFTPSSRYYVAEQYIPFNFFFRRPYPTSLCDV